MLGQIGRQKTREAVTLRKKEGGSNNHVAGVKELEIHAVQNRRGHSGTG